MAETGRFPLDLRAFWRNASPAQRAGLGAFLLTCLGLLALTSSLARRPHFAVLYGNLDQADGSQVIEQLRELKVPYRVTSRGTVEAPADRIEELRLDLAAEGVPAGGQAGFELFDRTRVGLSDFGEQLNYQRALQGELARTIAHLDAVEQARVHIALPRERLYASEQEEPSASVVLKLRGGARLTPGQVKSVVHLVSAAVGGLEPESVTLLDTRGRLLVNPDDSDLTGGGVAAASNQLQLRREYERQVEGAVQSMLDEVIGPGKAVVRASATLDFDRVETERETYEPAGEGAGVLESRQETRETYQGRAQPPAIGIPGVASNTGAGKAVAAREGADDHYEQSQITSEYLVSRQLQRQVKPPGQLVQLSLSVFLDQEADLGNVEDLSAAVSAAAGLDPNRGDQVVITRLPFQPAAPEAKASKVFAIRDFYFRVGRDFAAILIFVLFLRFVAGLLKRRPLTEAQSYPPADGAAPSLSESAGAVPAQSRQEDLDPDRAAAVLRRWLGSPAPGGDGEGGAEQTGPAT